ncbi:MAG: cytochrome c5 family protein [Granulosicoccus sp.]
MSGATDSGMVKMMGIVMACLSVIAVVCVFTARILAVEPDASADPMMRNALVQRIKPMAAVRTSADDLEVASAATAMTDGAAKSGEELVNGACAGCHIAGVAGAPKLNDEAAWAERRESGLDALVASVINGKGAMPARGASTYSDDEIRLAVQTMALFEVDDSAAAPAAEQSVAETVEQAAEATTEEASAAASTVAALVVGEVPDGLTDNIKATVDGVCSGCHIAGVAGAPKHGDTAAWQERADKGLAALTASVINGLNAMPARGGSALTDEEIPLAIQYLMSK